MSIHQLYEILQQHPIVTDSRSCMQGDTFLALHGESFNGNQFAADALAAGCAYAVVDDPKYIMPTDNRYILMPDCLQAYKELAREHRRHFQIPIIGITGTNGKTTTKELISAVLSQKYTVMHTEGNLNNDVGVPRTLLRLNANHQIAVVEMGASHPGDIRKLVEYVEPTCGLITNVGIAHIQGFGSFEGVVRTKGELYDYLRTTNNRTAFIDNDNPHLLGMAHDLNLVRYGTRPAENLTIEGQLTGNTPFMAFKWRYKGGDWHTVQTQLVGSYNIGNALAAITIGLHFDINEEAVCKALCSYTPNNNRSEFKDTGRNRLIIDAYNANPTSMKAALESLNAISAEHKLAILGDMRELGNESATEHQRIADWLKQHPTIEPLLIGDNFSRTDCIFRKFSNVAEATNYLHSNPPHDRYILLKGSNSMHLAQLIALL